MLFLKWAAPAALVSAVLALSACGGGVNATPGAGTSGQSLGAQRVTGEKHITVQNVRPNRQFPCPDWDDLGCYSDIISMSGPGGTAIPWCYGTNSDPCSATSQVTWSGGIVTNTNPLDFLPISKKKMSAAWTGPFPCDYAHCYGYSTGTYELDTITNGPKLLPTNKYKYGQEICINSTCQDFIGINVLQTH